MSLASQLAARKQFQHLRENAAYLHKAESPVVELVLPEPNPTLSGTQPLTGRRSPLRPAVSPLIWTAMIQNTPSDTVMGAGAKPKDIPHGTYAVLIPAVVGAMQEMQAEITTLQGSLTGNATTSDLTVYSPSNFSGDSVGEAEIVAGVSFGQAYSQQPI